VLRYYRAVRNLIFKDLQKIIASDLAKASLAQMATGSKIRLEIEGNPFLISIENKKAALGDDYSQVADINIKLSINALSYYLESTQSPTTTLGMFGVELMRGILSKDPNRAVELKINAGPMLLWRRGYIKLALSGGVPIWGFLAQHGLVNVKQILTLLKKMRSQ